MNSQDVSQVLRFLACLFTAKSAWHKRAMVLENIGLVGMILAQTNHTHKVRVKLQQNLIQES